MPFVKPNYPSTVDLELYKKGAIPLVFLTPPKKDVNDRYAFKLGMSKDFLESGLRVKVTRWRCYDVLNNKVAESKRSIGTFHSLPKGTYTFLLYVRASKARRGRRKTYRGYLEYRIR